VHLTLRRGTRTLRFSLCRTEATQEMAALRGLGARPLPIGEWLELSGAEDAAMVYLVELPAAMASSRLPA
jgi:hypothetical protein